MLLCRKYAPKRVDDVLGNAEVKKQLVRWLLNWQRGVKAKPLLISGATGAGKTALVYALRDEYGLELTEMGASEVRNKGRIEKILGGAGLAATLSGKQKVIFVDDADAMAGRYDRGGVAALAAVLREGKFPAIVTVTDLWNKKVSPLRGACDVLKMRRVIAPSIAKYLAWVAGEECIECPRETIAEIARGANGDIRAALNDLEACSSGARDREKDIFARMDSLFRAKSYAEAREASRGDIEHEMLKLWIEENVPKVYRGREAAEACDMLSRADVFDGRIMRRQHWGFLRYSNDLMCAGVALASERKPGFVRFAFPSYLRSMGATKASRAMMKGVLAKIGKKVHVPGRRCRGYLPIVAHHLGENEGRSISLYNFDDEEVEFVLKRFGGRKTKAPAKRKAAPKKKAPEKKETSKPKVEEPAEVPKELKEEKDAEPAVKQEQKSVEREKGTENEAPEEGGKEGTEEKGKEGRHVRLTEFF